MRAVPRWLRTTVVVVLLLGTAPLWVLVVVLVGGAYLLWAGTLYAVVWTWWIGRGRYRVLFVYSDSPNWKEHIEQHVLPRLPGNAVVLNWSRRAHWPRFSLPVLLFRALAGDREFNPIALVFARFALVERFRFWEPLREAKRGRDESLRRLETAMFDRLEA